jgi:L-alanine-DL-glutamate epimerase-like enolase superfamily enzyme
MHVTEVTCYRVDIPAHGGNYAMSGGRRYDAFPSTVVRVQASDGTCGYGEASTLGSDYLDGFVASTQATVRELAPLILGCDVLDAVGLVRDMDRAVRGHYPGKSAIDIAMWDLRARLLGVPVATLLGGITQDRIPAFMAVRVGSTEDMVTEAESLLARGFRRIQIKVGDDPIRDAENVHAVLNVLPATLRYLACDANAGWTCAQTLRFLRALGDVDTFIEQPVESITELAEIRAVCDRPIVIDEAAKQPRDLLDAVTLRCADALNLKLTRVGGLTKAAAMRDIAHAAGMMLTVDEPMGEMLATAAMAQFAATVDPGRLTAMSYFLAEGARAEQADGDGLRFVNGEVTVTREPGLGFIPSEDDLGEPVFVYDGSRGSRVDSAAWGVSA